MESILEDVKPDQMLQRGLAGWFTKIKRRKGDREGEPFKPGIHHNYFGSGNFYLGDIWVMAGGSNMQGQGFIIDPFSEQKHDDVLTNDLILQDPSEKWQKLKKDSLSKELYRLSINMPDKHEIKTASLIPSFANSYEDRDLRVLVGLLVCTQQNSTLDDWKAPKDKNDKSLYTAMLNKIQKIEGGIAGVLWYQGESDASDIDAAESYYERLKTWISDLRRDLDNPNLPVVIVQIGSHRFDSPTVKENWKKIQDAQYRLMGSDLYTAGVASLDVELDSCTDLSAPGLSLVGRRLAFAAIKALRGYSNKAIPKVFKVSRQKFTYYRETIPEEIMSINVEFENLDTPWNIMPDQLILGFSVNESETLIAKVKITNVEAGSLRLYLTKVIKGPLTLSYGMQPGVANLVSEKGIALPAFRGLPV